MRIPRIGNFGGGSHGIGGGEFKGKSIGIGMRIPRIGNFGMILTVSGRVNLRGNL